VNGKARTPEKGRKGASYLAQDNFFSSTIDKLKHLLEEHSCRKTTQIGTQSSKNSKDITAFKGQSEASKRYKKGGDRSIKDTSVLHTKR
jgi:hypothetical protein